VHVGAALLANPHFAKLNVAEHPIRLAAGPVGVIDLSSAWLTGFYESCSLAALLRWTGTFLFVMLFLVSCVMHGKEFKGFTAMMKKFELCCPKCMAVGCLFFLLAGSILLLTGVPVFLPFSTYFGHIKPWLKKIDGSQKQVDEQQKHALHIMINISLFGVCLMIIGYDVPAIGNDTSPLGLHGALGPVGNVIGKIYDVVRPGATYIKIAGFVMFVLVFFLKGFALFVGHSSQQSSGCAKPASVAGFTCALFGSVLMLTGSAILMAWGCALLIVFLLGALYFAHLKRKDMHVSMILKKFAMLGACLMVLGYELPAIGQASW